ncbi:tetratricopeptide repeat protein [Dactylosporangium darangshiense]|uniref:Tetratricopeptide repeat protein n=1 Tax=Dactylosporangium darangshiense TaxID=579108 RepID=A0ABP8DT30_9ACTN
MTAPPDPVDEAVARHAAALTAWDEGRYAETVRLCRRALELLEAQAGAGHPDVANVLTLLAGAQDELGAHREAEAGHRRAVAVLAAFPHAGGDLLRLRVQAALGLAGCLRRQGRYAESERLYRAARDDAAGCTELELAPLHNDLGVLHRFAGRLDEAHACYARARAALEAAHGPDAPELAPVWHNLAGLAHARGEPAEGVAYARRSLALHRLAYPPGHPAIAADEAQLAALLHAAGHPAEAEPLLRAAIATLAAPGRYGPDHIDVLAALHNLAAVRADLGDKAEAAALYRRALDGKRRTLGPDHPETVLTLTSLSAVIAPAGPV